MTKTKSLKEIVGCIEQYGFLLNDCVKNIYDIFKLSTAKQNFYGVYSKLSVSWVILLSALRTLLLLAYVNLYLDGGKNGSRLENERK